MGFFGRFFSTLRGILGIKSASPQESDDEGISRGKPNPTVNQAKARRQQTSNTPSTSIPAAGGAATPQDTVSRTLQPDGDEESRGAVPTPGGTPSVDPEPGNNPPHGGADGVSHGETARATQSPRSPGARSKDKPWWRCCS
ncbi:hypothetical protein BOTBODRAFT_51398 [Botryobasidium botryosum FD-172 SS1]|uniref:Uncharacterized protein n=1 Tax=Botryobasidium botryosum (strain FD-172 SS1) TaxID=930990 RepID=A0A067MZA5_BOTB1|nr:hypothetical protein BOTBODRAFT_51398 [Botryobasidium botryosum FD-172 SS1]